VWLAGKGADIYPPEKVLESMEDAIRQNEYDGEVRVVRFGRAGVTL
jgi:hypothetical protein